MLIKIEVDDDNFPSGTTPSGAVNTSTKFPDEIYFIDVNGDLARRINPQERDIETKELYKPGTQTVK